MYTPIVVIVPAVAFQVTPVLLVPLREAVNCWLAPVCRLAPDGEMEIPITEGELFTVTRAEADFVVSATVVAVTV